jgi:hypothetical protein
MNRTVGLFVIVSGACLLVAGVLIYAGALSWFGCLPGDIRYEGTRTQIYVPLVSMLLVSLALSVILYLIRRFL